MKFIDISSREINDILVIYRDSWLAQVSDAFLFAGLKEEGGPLNRAPRTSIIAEILVLQGLSVLLQNICDITPQQYVKWHPGGALGKLRDGEKQAAK